MAPFIPVNLAEVKDIEALEPGIYSVRVKKMDDKPSKSGKPMRTITWQVTDEGCEHNQLWDRILLEEASVMYKWKQVFEATGIPYGPEGFDPDDLQDAECKVTVDKVVYEGKLKNEIVNYLKM